MQIWPWYTSRLYYSLGLRDFLQDGKGSKDEPGVHTSTDLQTLEQAREQAVKQQASRSILEMLW